MATAGRTLKVALVANTKNFRQGMMSAVRDAKGFQGKMGAVATSLRGTLGPALLAAAAAAGALAVKLGVDGVKAAIADQKTVAVLAKTLENLGQAHRQTGVEDFIANMESATGVADEQLRPALGLLLQATGDVDEAQRRMAQAMDIAIGTNNSLDSVVRALSKSLATGASGTLSRYNVMIDQNTVATEGFGAALDEAASGFDGLANEEARTLEGRLRILQTEAANVQEAFGYGIVNSLGGAGDSADDLSARLRDLKDDAEALGEAVGNSIGDLIDLAKGIMGAKEAVDDFLDSAGLLGDVVQGEVGGMINPLDKATGMVKQLSAALTGNDQAFLEAAFGAGEAAQDAVPKIETFGYTAGEAASEVEELVEQVSLLDEFVSRTTAILNYEAAIDDLRKSLNENGKTFDYNTKAGRENNKALLDFVQSTAAVAESQETAFGKVAYTQDALTNLAKQFDRTKMSSATRAAMLEPFQALIDDLAASEVDVTTLQQQLDKLRGKDITITTRFNFPDGRPPGGWPKEWYGAKGGMVPQFFAGGGMSRGMDTVPAMLAPGEFVMRRSAVKQFGADLFSQLNRGINPLAGMSPTGAGRGGGFQIGTINVMSAPGERAETSLPRALRRASFLAGVNG
jgi:hypothetical protein